MAQVEIIAANLKTNIKNSVKKIIKKVCAYARVSTDSEEQQTSYNSQIKYYTDKIKSNPEWEFVGIYADEGISGTQVKKRTEFMRMIEDALNGKIDMIIAKSISRFARNTLDTLKYVRLLREHNVDVYFEKENIHTLELDSEMFLTLYSAFAQAESESTSQNVTMGFRAKMKRGEPCGKAECYGYVWNKQTKTLEIYEEQAKVIRQIFDWYCDGIGCKTIARYLNEKNIPTYSGKKWEQSTIRMIIHNVKYVGDIIGQKYYTESPLTHKHVLNFGEKEKYYVKDHHEAIISRDTWNKAQEILKKRNSKILPNGSRHISNHSMKYTFSSKIVCGLCGTTFVRRVGSKKKDGSRNVYWECYQKIDDSKQCQHSKLIREDVLESIFIELYNLIIENKHKTKEQLLNAIRSTLEEVDYQKEIDKLDIEEEKLRNRLSKLVDMQLDDVIDKVTYISKEKEIKEQLTNIDNKRLELQTLKNENKKISSKIKEIEKVVNAPTSIKEFDRQVFDNIVEKIIVGEIDDNNNPNPNVVRFILKTGVEFKGEIQSPNIKSNGNKSVSLDKREQKILLIHTIASLLNEVWQSPNY